MASRPAQGKHLPLILLALITLAACHRVGEEKTVTSADGMFQIQVPSGWTESTDLNDEADIQVAAVPVDMYVIVLAEAKDKLSGINLEQFFQLAVDDFTADLENTSVKDPDTLVINGKTAILCEIQAAQLLTNIYSLVCAVETDDYFCKIIAWTLQDQKDKGSRTLRKIISTFQQLRHEKPSTVIDRGGQRP